MIKAGVPGAVTWVDLSTPDIEAAVAFYRELLAWTDVEESETPMGKYYIGKVGERQAGGLMGQGPELAGNPATWTMFIYVDDLEVAVTKAGDAGGAVLQEPFDIPGGARIAVIADPTGAMMGLFAGPEIEGEFFSPDPGRVCWTELLTRDPATAEGFYADMFGWKAQTDDASGTVYTVFKLGEEMAAGMMMMPDQVPAEAPAHWSAYFTVDDCHVTEARAVELGGKILVGTKTIDMGKFAVLSDSQGAVFNIMEYTE